MEIAKSETGGHITLPAKPGDKPRIVIDPTKVADKSDATSILIFELVRFEYKGDQDALDRKVSEGKLTLDKYATECERLAYNSVKIQHQIVVNAAANGKFEIVTDRYEKILSAHPTFEQYFKSQIASGHYKFVRESGEEWLKDKPMPQPTGNEDKTDALPSDQRDAGIDRDFSRDTAGNVLDVDPQFANADPIHNDVDPQFSSSHPTSKVCLYPFQQ